MALMPDESSGHSDNVRRDFCIVCVWKRISKISQASDNQHDNCKKKHRHRETNGSPGWCRSFFDADAYGKKISFFMEPGRFLVAESGVLLTKVCSRKQNEGTTYIGTDCGFNILMRPMAYGAYHEIVNCDRITGETELVDVCGNICETGDLLAEDREMTKSEVGDTLAVLDAGAYGYSMASTYNCRVRPAEILIEKEGKIRLIRRRETLDNLVVNQLY